MDQLIQIAAALCILAAFTLNQLRLTDQGALGYLLLNAAGSGILCGIATQQHQWGFTLLEGAWCAVSLLGVPKVLRTQARTKSGPP